MRVVVEPNDLRSPPWSELFAMESAPLTEALGSGLLALHHIGSTAIPGMHAKPVLDLMLEVTELAALDARQPHLEELGYEALGEYGIAGRRYFRKSNAQGIRSHQIHAFAHGDPQLERHLAFRDFMRAHPAWARRYSDLKRELAQAHPNDIEAYMDGKDAFIQDVDRRAADWRSQDQRRNPRET